MSVAERLARAIAPYAWDRAPGHLSLMQAGKWRDQAQANARDSASRVLAELAKIDAERAEAQRAARLRAMAEEDAEMRASDE